MVCQDIQPGKERDFYRKLTIYFAYMFHVSFTLLNGETRKELGKHSLSCPLFFKQPKEEKLSFGHKKIMGDNKSYLPTEKKNKCSHLLHPA
jgi:hypothetical protein